MPEPALIQVASVKVEKLFGLYDHTIPLKLKDRVTIIHGPNGVGKTWVLRLLAALFGGQLTEFCRVPIRRFEVTLTDGSSISIEHENGKPARIDKGTRGALMQPLKLTYRDPAGSEQTNVIKFDDPRFAEALMMVESEAPWLTRIGGDRWMDGRTGTTLSASEILSRYGDLLPATRRGRARGIEPDWFPEIAGRVRVHLIEAQRLLRLGPPEPGRGRGQAMVATVRDYAQDLLRRVHEALARYA